MNTTEKPRLILTPIEHHFIPDDLSGFIKQLETIGFIGSTLDNQEQHSFDIGDDFLHMISFLGCSPTLYSQQSDDQVFISVSANDTLQFAHCNSMPPPRCPHCNKTDKNWPEYATQWRQNNQAEISCPNCQENFLFEQMKWKKNGGYGRLLIQIHGVQEQLAIPADSFMQQLHDLTGTDWEYFFAT